MTRQQFVERLTNLLAAARAAGLSAGDVQDELVMQADLLDDEIAQEAAVCEEIEERASRT